MEDWFKPNGLPSINKEFTYLLTYLLYLLKGNYCKFATFKRVVNTKTSIIQMRPNTLKRWLENESKPINF